MYHKLTLDDLACFSVKRLSSDKLFLLLGRCRNGIVVSVPFSLDEKVALLVGMMPDGSIPKDINSVMFSQKKDPTKIIVFKDLLQELFGIQHVRTWIDKTGTTILQVANKTLATFMHDFFGVPTSVDA
ncbi:MAG: hypothetical protein AB1476_02905 [Candidatus Hadarchaeota archaeon]